jgi:8-oxo-dGTP pyrophosphatase MutT (NUDIX family)
MSASIAQNVDRLNKDLFPDDVVKPVKAAGVWVLAKHPVTHKYNVLLGQMIKTNPDKPETHMFNKTYSGFSGKANKDEEPVKTAVRELQEETFGVLGTDDEVLGLIASDTTKVLKNMGWSKYPVATYVVIVKYSDTYIGNFANIRPDDSEIECLKWVPLNEIWHAIDTYEVNSMSWGQYNSADNLRKLFEPLNGVYTGIDLELKKNTFKHNLPVMASDDVTIEIADYVARTFMEYKTQIES